MLSLIARRIRPLSIPSGLAIALFAAAPDAGAQPEDPSAAVVESQPEASELAVGAVSELDLSRLSSAIQSSMRWSAPIASERRPLSLEEAVELALEQNLRLQVARIDVDAQEPEVDATHAKFHPSLGADGTGTSIQRDVDVGPVEFTSSYLTRGFVRQEIPTGGSVALGGQYSRDDPKGEVDPTKIDDPVEDFQGLLVEVRQPLLRGGRIFVARRLISDAESDLEIQRMRLNSEVLLVTAETKGAYYSTILAERLIEVVDAAVGRDEQLLKASEALFQAGRTNRRDVYSAEIQLANDRAELATRQAEREVSQNQLRNVLGLPIGTEVEITDDQVPFRPIDVRLEQWIATALELRPELHEIEKRLEKAELERRVRRNDIWPQFDVFGAYRHDLRQQNDSHNWDAGFLFDVPIANVAARRRVSRADLQYQRIERELVDRKRGVELEVRENEIRLRESLRRLEARIREVQQARAKRQIAQVRFQLGHANNFDITDADQELVAAETDLLKAVVDYATNLAFLEARVAGPL